MYKTQTVDFSYVSRKHHCNPHFGFMVVHRLHPRLHYDLDRVEVVFVMMLEKSTLSGLSLGIHVSSL